ncbi:ABC transporter permease [Rhodoluna sp.]|uniref:ABC transporter permease n=1 Tax=Rhodoluna sp. TaxID=1969481 RepID=UPI0025DFA8C7|nr:ABC transporter permease [Rhodoluna sp.]
MAFGAFAHSTSDIKHKNASQKTGKIAWILLAPGLAYLALFFLAPLFSLIAVSLGSIEAVSLANQGFRYGFNIQNFAQLGTDYLPHVIRSFSYALIATAAALLISYPLAYFIGVKLRGRPLLQRMLVTLVIAPFFISFLLRTLAWSQIFSNESWIVHELQTLGLLAPDQYIIGTPFAVVFGLTYNFIPFMTLPLYTTLEKLDIRYLEAGADLYASPRKVFTKVTLPLSMPGVISGTLLTFIPMAGDYVNASKNFLGSAHTQMLGNVIESKYISEHNMPIASALSVALMAVILIIVGVYVKRTGSEDLL